MTLTLCNDLKYISRISKCFKEILFCIVELGHPRHLTCKQCWTVLKWLLCILDIQTQRDYKHAHLVHFILIQWSLVSYIGYSRFEIFKQTWFFMFQRIKYPGQTYMIPKMHSTQCDFVRQGKQKWKTFFFTYGQKDQRQCYISEAH